jgi:hypothetical protein
MPRRHRRSRPPGSTPEARRLRQVVIEAKARAQARCEAVILEELTAARVTFAQERPEAPRANLTRGGAT